MYTVKNINDYSNKISEEQAEKLVKHCNEHDIAPSICAWYENIDDLFNDYMEHCGYNVAETKEMMSENVDIFCEFSNGEIVKLTK